VRGQGAGWYSVAGPGETPRRLGTHHADAGHVPRSGGFVVFNGLHEDHFRIWRMDTDGSDARVLTSGKDDLWPVASPDGQWVYYVAFGDGDPRTMRVPAAGGESTVLNEVGAHPFDITADGRLLLVRLTESEGAPFAVMNAETGAIERRFELPRGVEMAQWSPDGQSVAFIDTRDGASNLWAKPIDGSAPPRQVTSFTSGSIFHFSYSQDGRILLARGQRSGDAVLVRNFR
jgi:Tol biopolymer transport system component